MDSAFSHLNVPSYLACDFLGVFARSEYALKAGGFARDIKGHAEADWNAFADAISKSFDPSKSQDLSTAVNYLLTNPPKKQVMRNNKVEFSEAAPEKNQSKAQQVLVMVRRVRNNLFHGGKFLSAPTGDDQRDEILVQHSLTILRACIKLHNQVNEAYAN